MYTCVLSIDCNYILIKTTIRKYGSNSKYCSGLHNAISQNMEDRLKLAEFAGCKTTFAEEFYVILASFSLLYPLLFCICTEVNFYH
jgi:hypothetical protein